MARPRRLLPGDRVAVVAPSGPFDGDRFASGLQTLRVLDLEPVHDPRIFARRGYLAGEDGDRLASLEAAIADPDVKAIWAARGGYGAMRLLGRLRLHDWVQAEKLLVGFSDITALHASLNALGFPTLHAPVLTQLSEQPPKALARLHEILFTSRPAAPLQAEPLVTLHPGKARGKLVGGNLSLLASLVGTPFLPSLAGALLLIEDIGERPYRIDRLWTQLRLSGALDGVRGVVVGQFLRCEGEDGDPTPLQLLEELIAPLGVPSAATFPIGHATSRSGAGASGLSGSNEAVPLGVEAELDADAGTLTFLEGLVA
jgi:muramoyltetrapeptide carboxypeptidase